MILAWLCRSYQNIIFLDFHISMQLISETGLFHNFYELQFTGIDQNKEMICFSVLSYIIYLFWKYLYNIWSINMFNKHFNPDSLWLTPLRKC